MDVVCIPPASRFALSLRACVLCFALLLTCCYCAALLLLHARPPVALMLPWPCKPARHTHHPYPHLDQPASDLKASDDGAPLLLLLSCPLRS